MPTDPQAPDWEVVTEDLGEPEERLQFVLESSQPYLFKSPSMDPPVWGAINYFDTEEEAISHVERLKHNKVLGVKKYNDRRLYRIIARVESIIYQEAGNQISTGLFASIAAGDDAALDEAVANINDRLDCPSRLKAPSTNEP